MPKPDAQTALPTVQEIYDARHTYSEREPRGLFYKVASEIITLALAGETHITLTEAVAVLLQTWNRRYYQKGRRFDNRHFKDVDALIEQNLDELLRYRARSILQFGASDANSITILYGRFKNVLGPVGAAKCLHLLAPNFFPIWDNKIATAYRLHLQTGTDEDYVRFMEIVQKQCSYLLQQGISSTELLKALDEYNYCRYTLPTEEDGD
jgi:hypothetical protein